MKNRKRMLATAAASVALLALAACSSGGGAQTSTGDFSKTIKGNLSAWGFDNADDVGTSRLDYAKAQLAKSKVTIKIDATAFDAQKFTTRVASGDIPDVVQMDRQFVATYAAQGLIMPLDQCFSLYGVDPDKYWYPQVVDDVRYDNKVYAAPQFYQPPAILLDTRVMDAAGVTAGDLDTSNQSAFIDAVKKMTVLSG